jgi:hypothetical protein
VSRLALFLFVVVLATHAGYPLLASTAADPDAAARSWFYVLRGIEGTALFAVVAAMARSFGVAVVCAWGAFEESQTSVCRLAMPMGEAPAILSGGLCDEVLPVYVTGVVVLLAVGAWMSWRAARG